MTLEEALREAAAKGLTHVTLWPVPSEDGKKTYWSCRATPSTGHKYVETKSLDPAEAMLEVLKAMPKAAKRTAAKVTATVSDEPSPTEGGIDEWLPKT
jgi:hypothetical protein